LGLWLGMVASHNKVKVNRINEIPVRQIFSKIELLAQWAVESCGGFCPHTDLGRTHIPYMSDLDIVENVLDRPAFVLWPHT